MDGQNKGSATASPEVYVLDDDESVLRLVTHILAVGGRRVAAFSSPRRFLAEASLEPPCCLLLDVHMPELTGPEIQRLLQKRAVPPAIVFISGEADIPTSVQAMKAGAVDFLAKPFSVEQLQSAVEEALRRSREWVASHCAHADAQGRLARLTPRERQVCLFVAAGMSSKQIAAELGTALKTVNVHRSRIIAKLGVSSVAELVWLVARASARPD